MADKDQTIPDAALEALPMFPLPGAVFFPGAALPLHIFEPRYRDMVKFCLDGDRALAVALLQPGYESEYLARPDVHPVMGAGIIVAEEQLDDGRWNIIVRGTDRVRCVYEHPVRHRFREIRAERLVEQVGDVGERAEVLRGLALQLAERAPKLEAPLKQIAIHAQSPGALADHLAAAFVADPEDRQALLAELDAGVRVDTVTEALGRLLLQAADHRGDQLLN